MGKRARATGTPRTLPDSSASIAGYEYQFLWAALRCLSLLAPNSRTTQVVVESLYEQDIETLQAEDEDLLVIDVSEYEGGSSVCDAERITVTQLKYSPTAPDKAWTVNSLCKSRSGNPKRSIIGGLGLIFRRFWDQCEAPEELPPRLVLRLVTNRPLQRATRVSIEKAQAIVRNRQSKKIPEMRWVLSADNLTDADKSRLTRLRETSGLQSRQFATFLACLDTTKFDQPDLDWLDTLARKTLVNMGASWREDVLHELLGRVRNDAMKKRATAIRAEDVLAYFFCDRAQFLPAPNRIIAPEILIETEDARNLASLVCHSAEQRFLAHGTAGKGKSITVSQIEGYLPDGSRTLVYDCYGNGEWEGSSSGYRHSSKRFCNQITNEIAVTYFTGVFYSPAHTAKEDRWVLTRRALQRVNDQLPDGALFLLIVDAADNARDSYESCSEYDRDDLFLEELWRLPLPEKVRLVVTCRTNRRKHVCAPSGIAEHELTGFEPEETRAFLTQRVGPVSNKAAAHFHQATHSTPRLQDYWISELLVLPPEDRETTILGKEVYGTDEYYGSCLESASNGLPASIPVQACVAVLRCMRPPFELADFAGCTGLSIDQAQDFCLGFHPGLLLTDLSTIEFRDQDLEAFLDASLSPTERGDAHGRVASWCTTNVRQRPYAPRNVAFHLDKAQRYRDLIDRSLDLGFARTLTTPHERDACATESVHLALRACREVGDFASPLHLAFSLARLARGREIGKWLFHEFPEICVQQGLHSSVRRVLLEHGDLRQSGSLHFRIAVGLGLTGSTEAAQRHIEEGEAWLRKQIAQLDNSGMPAHIFNVRNSAERALAYALLRGLGKAIEAAMLWTSEATKVQALYEFGLQAEQHTPGLITRNLTAQALDPVYLAAMMAGVFRAGGLPEGPDVRKILESVLTESDVWLGAFDTMPDWMVDFAELCLRRRAAPASVLKLLETHSPGEHSLPTFTVSRAFWEAESDTYLRTLALLNELKSEEWSAKSLFPAKQGASGYDHGSEQAKSVASKLLPAYKLRAKALHRSWNAQKAWHEIEKSLASWRPATARVTDRYEPFFHTYALHVANTLVLLAGSHTDAIDALAERGEEILHPLGFVEFCMSMAEVCVRRPEYRGTAEDLTLKALAVDKTCSRGAKAQCSLLIRASALFDGVDADLAGSLFADALTASQDVDEDAPHVVRALARTARVAGARRSAPLPKLAQDLWKASSVLEQCAEDGIDWGEVLGGISALDSTLGYAAMWRLDQMGSMPLQEGLPHYLDGMLCAPTPADTKSLAGVLLPLCDIRSSSLEILVGLLSQLPQGQLFTDAFSFLARVVLLDSAYERREDMCRTLLQLASSRGLSGSAKEKLSVTAEFYARESNWQRQSASSAIDASERQHKRLHRLRAKIAEGTFDSEPAEAVKAIMASGAYGADLQRLLVEQGRRQKGMSVSRYLDAVSSVKGDGYYSHEAMPAVAIADLLKTLPQRRIVERWVAANYVSYAKQTYPSLIVYDSDYDLVAKPLLELDCVDPSTRAQAVLEILVEHGHTLPPRRLYELAGTFAGIAPSLSLRETLRDEMEYVARKAQGIDPSILPSDPVELGARLVCDALDHVDNRIRWRALHAFRLAVVWAAKPFIAAIIDLLKKKHGELWMSVRDWLLFSLLNICREVPTLVAPHSQVLWNIVTDKGFPHAGHQELAKRILVRIADQVADRLAPQQVAALSRINQPKAFQSGEAAGSVGPQKSFRFHFDRMDTFPYWYSYLGHTFGLHRCDVAVRAEKWICDEWGLSDAACRRKEELTHAQYNWGLTSHDHGSRPTVETFTRYVELHAMMMAAGEMVRDLPGRIEHYADCDEDRWADWIGRRAFAADVGILSDIRGPVPLDPVIHGARLGDSATCQQLAVDDFRSVFKTSAAELCVAGYYSAKASGVSWTWSVDTALVSQKMARSLGLALLGTRSIHAVVIPAFSLTEVSNVGQSCLDLLADGLYRIEDRRFVESEPFRLRPWIVRCFSAEELGGKDPMWREGGRNWYALDLNAMRDLDLTADRLRLTYSDRNGRQVAWCQVWNDEQVDSRYRQRDYSAGSRLLMLRTAVVDLLKQTGLDLVVRVSISRYVERSHGSDQAKYESEAGIFILRQNGRTETVGIRAEPRGEADL